MKKTIAVDLDGVIHKYSNGWRDGSMYDEPIAGSHEALAALAKDYKVVIFTTRLNPMFDEENEGKRDIRQEVEDWLVKYGFIEEVHYHDITALKPPALVYIDDRAVRFTNWGDTLAEVRSIIE